jgi:hypothetical protein
MRVRVDVLGGVERRRRWSCDDKMRIDEASGGYIMDPAREVGNDKSKPQNFVKTRTAVRIDNACLNFQCLGERPFSCSIVRNDIMQVSVDCRTCLRQASGKVNLSQLDGPVGDGIGYLSFDAA